MVTRYILALLILLLLVSCQNSSDILDSEHYMLVESTVKKFPLDKSTSYDFLYLNTISEPPNQEVLVALNTTKPSVLFYDMAEQTLIDELLLEKTGPNGVGAPHGLYLQSKDSIYVISSYDYKIRLINDKSKVIRSYNILNNEKFNESTGLISPYSASLPIKIKDQLYFSVIPDRDPFKPSFFDGYINLKLNLKTGTFNYFNSFPKEFKNNIWGSGAMDYSFTLGQDQSSLIYSFDISDSLLIYDIEKEQKYRVNAKSVYKQQKAVPMKARVSNADMEERQRYNLTTTFYAGIVYDQFNEVYYRFVQHAYPYKDGNGEINQYHEKPISVIIMNKNFELIGETKLADNTFSDWIYFISSDGLCIANANPENPDLDEDFVVFTCFQLDKP